MSADHAHLLEQVNALNIVRESNATLREDALKAERKAKTLDERLRASQQKVQPLEARVRELDATVSQLQQEIAILNEDNDRWKTRNQQILEKYDRVDPAEVQSLKDQVAKLTADLVQAEEAKAQESIESAANVEKAASLSTSVSGLLLTAACFQNAEVRRQQDMFKNLQVQTRALRERLNGDISALNNKITDLTASLEAANAAQSVAQAAVEEAQKSAETARGEAETARKEAEAARAEAQTRVRACCGCLS